MVISHDSPLELQEGVLKSWARQADPIQDGPHSDLNEKKMLALDTATVNIWQGTEPLFPPVQMSYLRISLLLSSLTRTH